MSGEFQSRELHVFRTVTKGKQYVPSWKTQNAGPESPALQLGIRNNQSLAHMIKAKLRSLSHCKLSSLQAQEVLW